jgi:hypothetical protein
MLLPLGALLLAFYFVDPSINYAGDSQFSCQERYRCHFDLSRLATGSLWVAALSERNFH